MYRMSSLLVAFLLISTVASSQNTRFRSGIFLHHSTGGCIWGPNGATTSVPDQIAAYNGTHGLSGSDSVSLNESGWPVTPWDNEWYRWHRIFDGEDTDAVIAPILASNRIVVIKSCFPSSSMEGAGSAEDTLSPTTKSVYNYKWHWRNFISVMRQYPDNFFVVWTNAPLVAGATNNQEALASDWFCRWAHDTLAQGLDGQFGAFPRNVYVFDFYHKLAGPDGKLPLSYASSSGDSHPNAAATELVAPQFVTELFDAAIAYESAVTAVGPAAELPRAMQLFTNYPNPFNPATTIRYAIPSPAHVMVKVYDVLGREVATLIDDVQSGGSHWVSWNATGKGSGVYYCRLQAAGRTQTERMLLVK